jgi:UTP--glucose-1-phosphate uridylyltransferase
MANVLRDAEIPTDVGISVECQILPPSGKRIDFIVSGRDASSKDSAIIVELKQWQEAEKTPSDVKGGHLARHRSGRLLLREAAQCPKDEIAAFQDIRRYRFFNTNNIWVSLKAMKALLAADAIQPPVIVGEKKVRGNTVLELETAAGAAIEFFSKAVGIRVPRSRFLPVKSTSDLLAVQSNLFDVRHGSLVQSQKREAPNPPVIKQGDLHNAFGPVQKFHCRGA